jgi:hypothetical protein
VDGCFDFRRKQGTKNFEFNFRILLHLDDIALLHHIQSKLGVGTVKTYRNTALYKIIRIKDIQVIIDIFESNPLNTTKHLNFLDFKKAPLPSGRGASRLMSFTRNLTKNLLNLSTL